VREFAKNELRPLARESDESGKLPNELLARAHELGLVANALPEEFGGGGARSAVTGALIAEELAWGDLSLALGILCRACSATRSPSQDTRAARGALPADLERGRVQHAGPGRAASPDAYRPAHSARRTAGWLLEGAKCLVPWPTACARCWCWRARASHWQGFWCRATPRVCA
jgi:alkylation response protein AidB-like acyl-CoA dehydrogenase